MAVHTDMKIVNCLKKELSQRTKEDLDNVYNYLHQFEACRRLREPALRRLCAVARFECHPANDIVYDCGDVITCWYILLSGSVFIDHFLFTARSSFGERQEGDCTYRRKNKCLTVDDCDMIVFDYEGCSGPANHTEPAAQLFTYKRLSRHLSDASLSSFNNEDWTQRFNHRQNGQVACTFATSSDTSSVCSSLSAMQQSSEGGVDDDRMLYLHGSGRGYDFSGLEESTVDTDEEEDLISVNTECLIVPDVVRECLDKDPQDRTDEDIDNLLNAIQHLQAFSNLTLTTRRALCAAMVFAVVDKADTVVMNDGEELDSWCVIMNGQVEVGRNNGTIEQLQLGDSFGVTPTAGILYHDGIMHTKVDDCQFLCIPQEEYYRILHEGEEKTHRLSENGELVLVTEQLVSDGTNRRQRIILRGTPEKLIEELKYDDYGPSMYLEDFLLTYRTFIRNTRDITDNLLHWFDDTRLRDKVISILLEWINNHFTDFETNPILTEFLEKFENQMEMQNMKAQLRLINIARTAKAQPRTVVLTRAKRDEVLHFSVLGGIERGCGLFITKVERGSKAEDAGLKRGDQILDVNSNSFEKISHNKALDILRSSTHLSITVKSNALGFKEMLEMPTSRPPVSKKHSKHSSTSALGSNDPSSQPGAPIIMSTHSSTHGSGMNSQFDNPKGSTGFSSGQKAAKIRRALARLNILPLNTSSELSLPKGKTPGTLSTGSSPLLKNRFSASHPDLSSLQLLHTDYNPNVPEHCLKVFKSDHTFRYLLVHKETTAHEVVMLALQEFGITESSSKFSLYEVTVQESLVKQRRLPDQLNNLADRCHFNSRYYIKHEKQTEPLLPDHMTDDIVRETQPSFLLLNCVEIATQLTLRDFQLFRDIQPAEYVVDLFHLSSTDCPYPTSHLSTFSELSNDEMFWVVTEVCSEPNITKRAKIIKNFIQIAKHCQEYKNFNSMFAIISGLGHGSVSRLKQTWDKLPNKWIKLFENLQDLMDPSRNMAKYRNLISSDNVRPPLIPFFPLVKKDLTFIHLGNDSMVEGLVNFEKLRMIATEIRHVCDMAPVYCDVSVSLSGAGLLRKQTSGFTVPNTRKMFEEAQMVRRVRAYLADLKTKIVRDENVLAQKSARCEPPQQAALPPQSVHAGVVRRRDVSVNVNVNVAPQSSATLAPKFGAHSPDSVRKMSSLSDSVRPVVVKKHHRSMNTHFCVPPSSTMSGLSAAGHSPSSVRSCPGGSFYAPNSEFVNRRSQYETGVVTNGPEMYRLRSDLAHDPQSSRRSSSIGSMDSVQFRRPNLPSVTDSHSTQYHSVPVHRSTPPVAPTRRSRPTSSQSSHEPTPTEHVSEECEISTV